MITGKTQLIAHIGVPTESFKAPMIYNPWFADKDIDTVVVPMGCETEDFPDFLRLLFRLRNFSGALVTMPHKVATVELLDIASTAVQICGACNAVKLNNEGQLVGDIFDGTGFVGGLRSKNVMVEGNHALVVGSGGVGSSIAASLAAAGVTKIGLFDTNTHSVEKLATNLSAHYPNITISIGSNDPVDWGIVVNATPLGMQRGDPMPFDTNRLAPSTFVGEVVMTQAETPLLAAAKARGCLTQAGVDMLFEQIPAYLDFFGYPIADVSELRHLATIAY